MEQLVLLAAAALVARVGLALYTTGLSRSKNATAAVMRVTADACFTCLAFWAVGAALLWQMRSPVLGLNVGFLFGGGARPEQLLFQAVALLTATGAVASATAERARFFPIATASWLLGGIVLPVAGNWAWYGWLRRIGFVDVAGATALHVSAGLCAVIAAAAVGARTSKYNRDGSTSMIPGHSLPLAAAGALLILVGWVPYVAGSATLHPADADAAGVGGTLAARAAADVLFAAAAGGAAGLLFGQLRYRKPDVMMTVGGLLGGMVAAGAGAGYLGTRAAVVTGLVAGFIVPAAAGALEVRLRVDDAAGLAAVHLVGGAWGTIAVALFAPDLGWGERLRLLGVQAVGLLSIAAFAAALSVLLFLVLRATVVVRTREAEEFDGLDLAEHDVGAYPDFQQNTIRSYHLREA